MIESMKEKTRRLERMVKGKTVGKTDTFVFSEVRKMIELADKEAIAEEREACVQKAALWALTKDMSSNLRLGLASAIRGRTADPKDEACQ